MMFGCSSLAEVRASRWKRSTNSLSNARENGSTLIATSRSSCFSFALKTIAIPPRPSSSRISYSSWSSWRTMSISEMSGVSSPTGGRVETPDISEIDMVRQELHEEYEILDELGRGGMAIGFQAKEKRSEERRGG